MKGAVLLGNVFGVFVGGKSVLSLKQTRSVVKIQEVCNYATMCLLWV